MAFFGFAGAQAQDVYTVERLSSQDLDGDANYVGMGGAMSALGMNLSALSTNPASGGLYRSNDMSITAGLASTPYGGTLQTGPSRTRGSFDQAGFMYALNLENTSGVRFLNLGFNYKRSRNLKSYIGLNNIGLKGGMSQTWQLADLACDIYNDVEGDYLNLENADHCALTVPLSDLAYQSYLLEPFDYNDNYVTDPKAVIAGYDTYGANRYNYHRAQWGGVEDYEFNLSMNINDRVYLGAGMGVYNVDTHSATIYDEELVLADGSTGVYTVETEESLTGVGYDGKFGVIVRPLEDSPFRVGLSITTPTAYDLDSRKYVGMWTPFIDGGNEFYPEDGLSTSYRIRTPWRLNLSAATIIGSRFAIDAEYELQNYSSAAVRYRDRDHFSYNGSSFYNDADLQEELRLCMRNVHTFRLGAEARLSDEFSARVGYNYVSSPFEKDAYLNLFVTGGSYQYATNTDYVNLGATNRVSLGLGYRHKFFYMDAAYVFQKQTAEVFPFHYSADDNNIASPVNALQGQKYDLNRHQFMVTMGFSF